MNHESCEDRHNVDEFNNIEVKIQEKMSIVNEKHKHSDLNNDLDKISNQ